MYSRDEDWGCFILLVIVGLGLFAYFGSKDDQRRRLLKIEMAQAAYGATAIESDTIPQQVARKAINGDFGDPAMGVRRMNNVPCFYFCGRMNYEFK